MKRETMLVGTLAVAFGLLNMATAQAAGDGHAAKTGSGAAAGAASAAVNRAGTAAPIAAAAHPDSGAIKPGDRNCLQSTGSLIPARPGHCLAVSGRSYGQRELRETGQIDAGRALQQLDPSISAGR